MQNYRNFGQQQQRSPAQARRGPGIHNSALAIHTPLHLSRVVLAWTAAEVLSERVA